MLPARSLVSNLLESETTKGEREKSSQNKCNSGLKWSNIHSRPSYNTTNQNIAKVNNLVYIFFDVYLEIQSRNPRIHKRK